MKAIPIAYSVRNLWTRKLTTVLTAGGMALVVFVFAAVLMLDAGLRASLVASGQPDNILVTRRASGTEIQSGVERNQAAIIESQPEIAIGPGGVRMVSKETVVLIAQPKRDTGVATNIVVRGVGAEGAVLRPQVRIAAGRSPWISTFIGMLTLIIFPFLMWFVVPVFLYAIGACLGGVGLGEIVGARLIRHRSRVVRTAGGTAILALLGAGVLMLGLRGLPQLCAVLIGLTLVGAWGLGASVLTFLGTRPWPRSDDAGGAGETATTSAPVAPAWPVPGVPGEPGPALAPELESPGLGATGDVGPSVWPASTATLPVVAMTTDPALLEPPDADRAEPVPGMPPDTAAASEAPGDDGSAVPPATSDTAPAGPAPATGPAGAEGIGATSDLRRVPGITPIYAQVLFDAGFTTVGDLAHADPDQVAAAVSVPGVLSIDADTAGQWVRNAQALVAPGD